MSINIANKVSEFITKQRLQSKGGAGFESAISGQLVSPAGRLLNFIYFMYQFWVIYGLDELRLGWCTLWGISLMYQVTYFPGWPCQNQYVLFTYMIMIHSKKPGIWYRSRMIFKMIKLYPSTLWDTNINMPAHTCHLCKLWPEKPMRRPKKQQ